MSDYTSWHVGMKVVCVVPNGFRTLTKGAVYTIRDMDEAWVYFEEPSTLGTYGPEWAGYAYFRFRPVAKRPTSIAIFERIRDNPKAPIIEPSPKQRERVS